MQNPPYLLMPIYFVFHHILLSLMKGLHPILQISRFCVRVTLHINPSNFLFPIFYLYLFKFIDYESRMIRILSKGGDEN